MILDEGFNGAVVSHFSLFFLFSLFKSSLRVNLSIIRITAVQCHVGNDYRLNVIDIVYDLWCHKLR